MNSNKINNILLTFTDKQYENSYRKSVIQESKLYLQLFYAVVCVISIAMTIVCLIDKNEIPVEDVALLVSIAFVCLVGILILCFKPHLNQLWSFIAVIGYFGFLFSNVRRDSKNIQVFNNIQNESIAFWTAFSIVILQKGSQFILQATQSIVLFVYFYIQVAEKLSNFKEIVALCFSLIFYIIYLYIQERARLLKYALYKEKIKKLSHLEHTLHFLPTNLFVTKLEGDNLQQQQQYQQIVKIESEQELKGNCSKGFTLYSSNSHAKINYHILNSQEMQRFAETITLQKQPESERVNSFTNKQITFKGKSLQNNNFEDNVANGRKKSQHILTLQDMIQHKLNLEQKLQHQHQDSIKKTFQSCTKSPDKYQSRKKFSAMTDNMLGDDQEHILGYHYTQSDKKEYMRIKLRTYTMNHETYCVVMFSEMQDFEAKEQLKIQQDKTIKKQISQGRKSVQFLQNTNNFVQQVFDVHSKYYEQFKAKIAEDGYLEQFNGNKMQTPYTDLSPFFAHMLLIESFNLFNQCVLNTLSRRLIHSLKLTSFNLSNILQFFLKLFESQYKENQLHLNLKIEPDVFITNYSETIHIILFQLFHNLIKYATNTVSISLCVKANNVFIVMKNDIKVENTALNNNTKFDILLMKNQKMGIKLCKKLIMEMGDSKGNCISMYEDDKQFTVKLSLAKYTKTVKEMSESQHSYKTSDDNIKTLNMMGASAFNHNSLIKAEKKRGSILLTEAADSNVNSYPLRKTTQQYQQQQQNNNIQNRNTIGSSQQNGSNINFLLPASQAMFTDESINTSHVNINGKSKFHTNSQQNILKQEQKEYSLHNSINESQTSGTIPLEYTCNQNSMFSNIYSFFKK